MMPRVIETYAVYIAALKTGIILIPSSEMLRTSDLEYRITHGEVSGIVSYHAFTDQFNGIEQWQALKKFAVGGEVAAEGWNKLEHLKETASEQLKMVETTRDDRKSTRLNSSHVAISYAVFCLKKKKKDKSVT